MSSIQKLVYHWKQGQFIPGGKPPQLLNNEVKEQRLSELVGDDMIVQDSLKGISILKDVVEAFKITQEFRKDPDSFSGDARDVLMSDDFLLVADVLRLIIPEGMISEVWQLKRRRDDDLDTQDDAYTPGNRRILIPKSKRLGFTNRPEAQENETQRQNKAGGLFRAPASKEYKAGGLFGMPVSQLRFTNGPKAQENETQRENKASGLFRAPASQEHKAGGLFSMPVSQLRFTNGPKAQENETQQENKASGLFRAPASQEHKPGGLFSMPASQVRFTNGPETQPEATRHANIFGAKDKDSNNSPALQSNGIFRAKEPAPEYRGIFSQKIGFASNPVVSERSEKVSDTPPTPPQTGPEHTESSSQYIGSLPGSNKEATLDNLLSSMGGDDITKILAQLQLHQQGIKRKHEEEKEIINKKQKNIQEPLSLIEL